MPCIALEKKCLSLFALHCFREKVPVHFCLIKAHRSTKYSKYFVNFLSVNQLLNDLSSGVEVNDSKFKNLGQAIRGPLEGNDFAVLIDECISNKRKHSSMDILIGLFSVKIDFKLSCTQHKNYFSIAEVAKLCDVNYENIRFVIKIGILKRVASNLTKGMAIYIDKHTAKNFNNEFIFGGCIAKKLGLNNTTISEKIMSLGIQPISGPMIDGGLTYLFRRDDINNIDLNEIKKITDYPTKSGRIKNQNKTLYPELIPPSEAGKMLKVSTQTVVYISKKGFLDSIFIQGKKSKITLKSVQKILRIENDNSLISIKSACLQAKQGDSTFFANWIESGFIEYIDSGLNKFISRDSLTKVMDFKSRYISSVEAAEIIGHHRSFLPNLEKRGLIKHKKILKNRKYSIKFYDREDAMLFLIPFS